ncbi:uncharacterized protein LOC105796405 isoform X2 [Gossypium raimondii]|uniref:Zinc finger PHD-type domain-containing protein n=1 Tax=Gossypium raimondii TaxID=29730 RepID=A0A0D2S9R2_GOSRA|nr:uncharacterized protein LOC105796405 isoform X2 [Gossypium raimondii]KJB27960.1 hypothetical protein B456_005G018700 [Gossypium raimondii]
MEESNNYGHQHPLLLILDQDQLIHNQSGVTHCSRCGEEVSAPCFCCVEHCGFYLHKACGDAPLELNHPFHPHHPLLLMKNAPYSNGVYACDFCDKEDNKFVYHCSCGLDFHIKCALFTFNIAENNLKELDHVALQDEELEDDSKCFGCWEPLAKYTHFSPDCRFNLHEKCAKLPFKLNHKCHHKHPLTLQFISEQLSCKICQVTVQLKGFVYGCSPCKFVVHIECVSESLALVVEDKRHEHPFTLLLRGSSFICDACGIEGSYASYICCTCNIMVHKKCTSLPRIIKSKWHDHRLFHKYFLHVEDFRVRDCIICHDEVNIEHGSYYCSECDVIFHVKCAMKYKYSYEIVENEDEESPNESVSSITKVLEWNDAGEATVIEHITHIHHLTLSDRVGEYDSKCCDGCLLPISDSFYYCTQCDFFVHKVCVELPKVKQVWHHRCQSSLVLTSNEVFWCVACGYWSKAFAYKCEECKARTCLRCIIALTPGAHTCVGHKHPVFLYIENTGGCVACGCDSNGCLRCKVCDFSLDHKCFSLPITSQHKNDQHLLSLAYGDDNSYSESHFCDVCEESRDPNLWFYHCATCDTSAHVNCVLGEHPFIKLGSIVEVYEDTHEHPLTVVKKVYYYPNCSDCGKPCLDLALECTGCNFIVHAGCLQIRWTKGYNLGSKEKKEKQLG